MRFLLKQPVVKPFSAIFILAFLILEAYATKANNPFDDLPPVDLLDTHILKDRPKLPKANHVRKSVRNGLASPQQQQVTISGGSMNVKSQSADLKGGTKDVTRKSKKGSGKNSLAGQEMSSRLSLKAGKWSMKNKGKDDTDSILARRFKKLFAGKA